MRAGLAAPGDLGRTLCEVGIFEMEGAGGPWVQEGKGFA